MASSPGNDTKYHTLSCGVCLDTLHSATFVISTSCGHSFHKECLEKWQPGVSVRPCPNCRTHIARTLVVFTHPVSVAQRRDRSIDASNLASVEESASALDGSCLLRADYFSLRAELETAVSHKNTMLARNNELEGRALAQMQ
jgi:hypothetical protein